MVKIEGVEFEWLGHDTFRITFKKKVIYTDPYLLDECRPEEKADLILISHEHYDHYDPPSTEKIKKEDTVIVASEGTVKTMGSGKAIKSGQTLVEKEIEIKALPAYNMGKPYHPEGLGIGFVIKLGKLNVYFAGDTDFIQEMKNLKNIHIAMVPIGGKYTMTEQEAAEAVKAIKPKYVIPMHYGTIENGDTEKFKKLVGEDAKVITF